MSLLVSYRRTSGDASESTSLESQRIKIEAKCISDDHQIVADFVDKESAETADQREGFQAALAMIYSGKADGLIVWKLDRFARSVLDGVSILSEFKRQEKQLVCVSDPIDTTSAMGEAFFQISMVFAELERKTIAERCNNGRIARGKQKRYACGAPPYGWRAEKQGEVKALVENSVQQSIIGMIKELRDSNSVKPLSFSAIAGHLTAQGITPPCRNRQDPSAPPRWNYNTVKCIYDENRKLAHWAMSGYSYNYLDAQTPG